MVAAARAGVMGPGAEGGERCGGGAEEDERRPAVPRARRRSANPRLPSRGRELRPAESRLLARWGRSARPRQQLARSPRCSPLPWPLRWWRLDPVAGEGWGGGAPTRVWERRGEREEWEGGGVTEGEKD